MLTPKSALTKDRRNANAPVLEHRHYAVIAGIIAEIHPLIPVRSAIAWHFARKLLATNPRFDQDRFLRACEVIGEPINDDEVDAS
jgi:hypothetical protein